MNLVFIGTSTFALPVLRRLAESPHRIMAVVTQPDRRAGRGQQPRSCPVKKEAVERGFFVYEPEDVNEYDFVRELRALSPDVVVLVAYGQKLADPVLEIARYAVINLHPSLLPRYRGPAPVARALLNGDRHLGASVIRISSKVDAGPVLAMTRVPAPPEATTPEMEETLATVGSDLILGVIDKIDRNVLFEVPQNEQEALWAKKFDKKEGRIDWRKTARRITDAVRAMQPFPGAFTLFQNRRLGLLKATGERQSSETGGPPGTVIEASPEKLRIACGDGWVDLMEVQPESRNRMGFADFLRGFELKKGDRLG